MSRSSYKVTATREDDWWVLVTDEHIASQTRRLDDAEAMIRDAISIALDMPEDSFDVEICPQLQDDVDELVGTAQRLRDQYEGIGRELSRVTATAVKELRDLGLSVRDVAYLLHLTPGRVSQIEHGK